VNILCFLDRKGRVINDEFLEFIPYVVFEIESRCTCARVANASKRERNVDGEVAGT